MAEEFFDVALQTSSSYFDPRSQDWKHFPPPHGNFALDADFWIGRLPYNTDSDVVFDACDPAGFNHRPYRQFGCRYAFCRKANPPSHGPEFYEWDNEGFLGRTLFLSRLIHPTTVAPHYSARLIFQDGKLTNVVPANRGYGSHVWIVANEWRDWLSETEAEELRAGMVVYNIQPPDRVRRARSHIDHAFHAFYLDQRTASLVSAFESLLKIGRNRLTAQFKLRVPALAKWVGTTITSDEADTFYDDRSEFLHGSQPKYIDVTDELMEQYNKFESVLRCALLRASTDVSFCSLFATDDAIKTAFGG
jgi:hypothetical protein